MSFAQDVKAAEVRRYAEIDRQLSGTGHAMSAGLACAAFAFRSLGPLLVALALTPGAMHLLRWAVVRTDEGLYRWGRANVATNALALVAASLATGGLWSPVLLLSTILGVVATMTYPSERRWVWLSLAVVVVTAVGTAVVGAPADRDWLYPAAILVAVVTLPNFVKDFVEIELRYRSKAVLDELTGCLNRTSLDLRLAEVGAQAVRTDEPVGVIVFDIDHFKAVNDEHGHAAGDEVLHELADRVRAALRRFELFYRMGGEEFLLLVPGANGEQTHKLAERLRAAIEDQPFSVGLVTMSVGAASEVAPPSMSALVDRADEALYEAKQSGRNRAVLARQWEPQPHPQSEA